MLTLEFFEPIYSKNFEFLEFFEPIYSKNFEFLEFFEPIYSKNFEFLEFFEFIFSHKFALIILVLKSFFIGFILPDRDNKPLKFVKNVEKE